MTRLWVNSAWKYASPQRREAVVLGALIILALVLRLASVRQQSFWYDESLTVADSHLPFSRMLGLVLGQETTPPAYFILAWAWSRIAGSGELGLRLFSVLCGTATVPVAYAAAARLFSRRTALITALLVATSPFMVWYSQEARSYALLVLVAALSFWAFARAFSSADSRSLAWWAVASSASLIVHYFAIFLVLAEAAWLCVVRTDRGAVGLATLSVALTEVAIAPLALVARQGVGLGWIPAISLSRRVAELPVHFAAGLDSPHHVRIATVALAVALPAVGYALWRAPADHRRTARACATVGLGTIALPLVLAVTGADYLVSRNVIVAWVPIAVVVASGLATLPRRALGNLAVVVLCMVSLVVDASVVGDATFQRPRWRQLARLLGPPHGRRIIVVAGFYRALPLRLYLPRAGFVPLHGVDVREVDVVGMRSPHRGPCWWGAQCNLPSARPASLPPSRRFFTVSRQSSGQFLVVRFRASSSVVLKPDEYGQFFQRAYARPRRDEFFLVQPAVPPRRDRRSQVFRPRGESPVGQ